MKLYYSPGACSLSPHIVLEEGKFVYQMEKVDIRAKKTETSKNFYAINPNGYVPVLELDNGSFLTEGPAIVQYLADQKPDLKLAPPNGTLERYQLQSWLNFISTELHKNFSPLFNKQATEGHKEMAIQNLKRRFESVARTLEQQPYVMGESFTVADAYLFTILRWAKPLQLDLKPWPVLDAYLKRVGNRPAAQRAMQAEGLGLES